MNIFADVYSASLNKHNEELCGDKVEVIRNEDYVIVVLADGLGSGVKANILATLTSKIIGTMLSMGATIDEAVETIINTLPICRERNLAYSTFSILQISNEGQCYLVEFDNPSVIRLVQGRFVELQKEDRVINDKLIKESRFTLDPEDVVVMISDGAIHAGVGQCLNLGWQWDNVKEYTERLYKKGISATRISKALLSACNDLYASIPGDDTTVVAICAKEAMKVNVLIGPPVSKSLDEEVINRFLKEEGKKIVCGGTTAQIVSRVTGREIEATLNYVDPSIPPTGKIKGIDLTTEGVLTISRVLEYARKYIMNKDTLEGLKNLDCEDGATTLTKTLFEEATAIHFFVGQAINPAHQNPDFPMNLGMKLKLVEDLEKLLTAFGKNVEVEYF